MTTSDSREELARSILALDKEIYFAVITYSKKVQFRTTGWVEATEWAKKEWAAEARKLKPENTTNIHGALTRAFKVNEKGNEAAHPAVDKNCMLSGAHTVVFLTDGWPSWSDDSDGIVTHKLRGRIGDGRFVKTPEIIADIKRLNIFRKVVINTVGIGNHDKSLLRALATDSGGHYTDWYFPEPVKKNFGGVVRR